MASGLLAEHSPASQEFMARSSIGEPSTLKSEVRNGQVVGDAAKDSGTTM